MFNLDFPPGANTTELSPKNKPCKALAGNLTYHRSKRSSVQEHVQIHSEMPFCFVPKFVFSHGFAPFGCRRSLAHVVRRQRTTHFLVYTPRASHPGPKPLAWDRMP